MLVAIGSVAMMMFGEKSAETRSQYTATFAIYCLFLLKPFALSASTLAMRTSKKLD